MSVNFAWTDDAVARLREHHAKGWTASGSAEELNREFGGGLSRNAVIGKRLRLGLESEISKSEASRRGAAVANAKRVRKPPKSRVERKAPAMPPTPLIPEAATVMPNEQAPGARMLGLLSLKAGQCRYPHDEKGDDGFAIFCAADAAPESSYCPCHRRLCIAGSAPRIIIPGEARSAAQQRRSDDARARMPAFHRKRAAGQQKAFS